MSATRRDNRIYAAVLSLLLLFSLAHNLFAQTKPGPTKPDGAEIDANARMLGNAMAGDRTLFARGEYVQKA